MNRDELRHTLVAVTRTALGRFVKLDTLRTCNDDACTDVGGYPDAIEQHDAFLETVEAMLQTTDPEDVRELVEVVREYRLELRKDAETIEADGLERSSSSEHHWVKGVNVPEVMDVSGMTGREASTFALLVRSWNPEHRGRVYVKRDGRRYLRPGTMRVDLNHPAMALHRDDVLASLADGRDAVLYDADSWAGGEPSSESIDAAAADLDPFPPLPPLKGRKR